MRIAKYHAHTIAIVPSPRERIAGPKSPSRYLLRIANGRPVLSNEFARLGFRHRFQRKGRSSSHKPTARDVVRNPAMSARAENTAKQARQPSSSNQRCPPLQVFQAKYATTGHLDGPHMRDHPHKTKSSRRDRTLSAKSVLAFVSLA